MNSGPFGDQKWSFEESTLSFIRYFGDQDLSKFNFRAVWVDEFVIEVGYIRYGYLYKSKIIRSKHSKLIFSKAIEARINPWISGVDLYFSSAN